jgi:hypothetical protein
MVVVVDLEPARSVHPINTDATCGVDSTLVDSTLLKANFCLDFGVHLIVRETFVDS